MTTNPAKEEGETKYNMIYNMMYSEGKNQESIDQGEGRTASHNLILTSDQPREEEEQKRGGRGGGERGERKVAGNGGYPQTRPLLTLGSFILL